MKQSKRKKEFKSEFSYNRLWKMLIDRNMKKGELQEISDVCNIEDIMERIPLQQDKEKNA